MYNKNIKLILAGLILIYAVYQFVEGNIGNGIALIFLAGIFVFFYFRNEFILLSFLRMRKQDLEGTEKWLQKIKNPQAALTTKQQGYYNYLYGIIYSQKNLTQAEKYFKKAIKLGLNMNYDLAMAKLSLAGIACRKGERERLPCYLRKKKNLIRTICLQTRSK